LRVAGFCDGLLRGNDGVKVNELNSHGYSGIASFLKPLAACLVIFIWRWAVAFNLYGLLDLKIFFLSIICYFDWLFQVGCFRIVVLFS
jgi:hypothetical protein